jgi:heme-degrading monooxygenase HmoA
MISRHWLGVVRQEHVNDYKKHLETDTFPRLRLIEGFYDAYFLTRDVSDGIEFLVISEWASIEAVKNFAGNSYNNAVVPDYARSMMVRFEDTVRHYNVDRRD